MATITASWHLLHLASTLFAPHSNNLKLFPALIFYCGSSTIHHPPSTIPSYFHRNLLTIRITHGSLLNKWHQKYFSSDFWSGDSILCKADIFHTDIKWSWYKSESRNSQSQSCSMPRLPRHCRHKDFTFLSHLSWKASEGCQLF